MPKASTLPTTRAAPLSSHALSRALFHRCCWGTQPAETMKKMMAAGGMKPEKVFSVSGIEKKEDYAEAAATLIAEAGVLAAAGELDRAIETLFALEKKCR